SIELVDPKVLRVCADPRNMPFSDEQGEGFENKLAELFAQKLGKSLAYAWYPQATGFVRNTLGAHKCDVIMGFPQGNDIVQSTNPYYRTSYALVFKSGNGLDGVDTLSDPRVEGKHMGVVASTPLKVVPLTREAGTPTLVYRITMGVRFSDQEWKRSLNRMIEENRPAINAILLGFGVPLLDENNQPIREEPPSKRP